METTYKPTYEQLLESLEAISCAPGGMQGAEVMRQIAQNTLTPPPTY